MRFLERHHKLVRGALASRSRSRHLSHVRQLTMLACRCLWPSYSLGEIAYIMGRRDHSTIIYGIRRAASSWDDYDAAVMREYAEHCGVPNARVLPVIFDRLPNLKHEHAKS